MDELFDIVACYFPISFTPPPDSPHQITRAQLTGELEATLTASPLFAHHLLPLLLEKLSSSLRWVPWDRAGLQVGVWDVTGEVSGRLGSAVTCKRAPSDGPMSAERQQ